MDLSLTLRRFATATLACGALLVAAPAATAAAQPHACGTDAATPSRQAQVPASAAKVAIPVRGMTCGQCVARVHNVLEHLDGVYAVRVDAAAEAAYVSYDAARVTVAALVDALRTAGYWTGAPHQERGGRA